MAAPLMFQPLVKYADFNGRARRSEFWLWILFRYLVHSAAATIAVTIMLNAMTPVFSTPDPNPQLILHHYFSGWITVLPLISLVDLAILIPTLAVCVRRMHDIGRSGWWIIMPYAVAIVGLCVFFVVSGVQFFNLSDHKGTSDEESARVFFGIVGCFLLLVFMPFAVAWIVRLVFFVTEGKRGPNRFGPDPKGDALNDTP